MKYVLGRNVLDGRIGVPISEDQYLAGRKAHDVILFALRIEQKFNFVIANYEEFEVELLTRTLRRSLYDPVEWSSGIDDIDSITRRIFNLLSSGRLYSDHLRHDISRTFGSSSDENAKILASLSSEYDSSIGYRVGEALRNFIQHRGLPLSQIVFNNTKSREAPRVICAKLIAEIDTSGLEAAGGFKASVLKELREIGEQHNLVFFLRKYVQSLGTIHKSYKNVVNAAVSDADAVFHNLIEIGKAEYDSVVGLVAAEVEEECLGYQNEFFIFNEPIKHRKALQEHNRRAEIVSNWYVSGASSEKPR